MIYYYSLSNTNAVLLEIQKIVRKKEKLVEIYKLTQFRDVSILFTATDKAEIQMIHITNDMLPFHLPNEIVNILEDSIDQYDKDISSLNQHLKNL
jgi:CO dehydrogenase/acetyl-CoA synthase alpha subunit